MQLLDFDCGFGLKNKKIDTHYDDMGGKASSAHIAEILRQKIALPEQKIDKAHIAHTLELIIGKNNHQKPHVLTKELKNISDNLTANPQNAELYGEDVLLLIQEIASKIKEYKDTTPTEHSDFVPPSIEKVGSLWLKRDKSLKETPPEFIARVYRPWLGKGLFQAHIKHIDKSLYMALHKWLKTNSLPASLDLPTKYHKHVGLSYTDDELKAYKKVSSIRTRISRAS